MRLNQKGASVTVAGALYVLTYDFNKLCEMEQVGIDLLSGKTDSEKLRSPLFIRQLFFDGCSTEDDQPLESLDAAGKLIGQIGFINTVKLIGEALASVATSESAGEADDNENPTPAQPLQ